MRKSIYCLLFILPLSLGWAIAQPVIQKIEPLISYPNSRILISGSGFTSTSITSAPSKLQVWFDQVKGTIISSTDFSIEVNVPAEARLANITVVNLISGLSTKSGLKFAPFYSGEGFDPAKLETPLSIPTTNRIFDIISVDVDGDNKPDLIGSRDESTATTMALMMNQSTIGNIAFNSVNLNSLNVNAPTGYLAVGDLNLDGKPDLVASRIGTTSNTVFVLTNTSTVGNPDFSAPLILTLDIAQGVREVGVSDLNGDGKPEIVIANSVSNNIYIYKNESTGGILKINSTPEKIAVTGATKSWALELQDLDNDGKTDIVVSTNQSEPDLYVLKNTSSKSSISFSNITKIALPGGYNDIATADFNNDGNLDIITTSVFTSQAVLLLNKSTSSGFSFAAPLTLSTDAQPFGIDVSDLNGDRFPDIIIPSRGTTALNVFLHNGNSGTVGFTKVTVPTNKTNWFVRAGDLDGDAKPDIAFTSFSGISGPFSVDILRNMNCHKPVILNRPPLFVCPAQTIKLEAIPIPGVTFNWSNGFASIKNGIEPFVNITAAATYTVTAIGESGACNVFSTPLIVQSGAGSLPADPVITTNAPLCAGNTLTLSAPVVSGATYSWTGPNNFTSTSANISIPNSTVADAGIYLLTIKVGDCSSNPVSKRVDVVTFGSFSISSSNPANTMCQGQSLTLTVNSVAGYTYQWIKDATNISGQTSASLNVTQEGSYKVKVSNATLGCALDTNPVSVIAYVSPVANFTTVATGCVDNIITFTNSSTRDSRVAATDVVYAWDFGDNASSIVESPTHTYAAAQAFSPKLTVSYSGVTGCEGTITKSIDIVSGTTPSISATVNELCANGSEKSTLTVTGTFTSYLWSTSATTATIDVTAPTDYTVETVDANSCIGTSTITITEKTTNCEPGSIEIPPIFTPNGDTQNDFWIIPGVENKQECTMNVFDGRGRRVLQKKGFPIAGWDGRSDDNNEVPQGTYYYVFSCPNEVPITGSVLIVR